MLLSLPGRDYVMTDSLIGKGLMGVIIIVNGLKLQIWVWIVLRSAILGLGFVLLSRMTKDVIMLVIAT